MRSERSTPHTRSPGPEPRDAPRDRDPRRALGKLGEEFAAAHLERLGFAVVARNVRTRAGEIDLIVSDGATLAFVEVKTRSVGAPDGVVRADQEPLPRLRPRQRARLRRLAAAWLHDSARVRPAARTIRFDAVGVIVDRRGRLLRLEHIERAW